MFLCLVFFFFKQKTAYEMRISDWSSDVCSSDLHEAELRLRAAEANLERLDDVIGALEEQLKALKRQARQASRYRNLNDHIRRAEAIEIGRASCRERVCQYV